MVRFRGVLLHAFLATNESVCTPSRPLPSAPLRPFGSDLRGRGGDARGWLGAPRHQGAPLTQCSAAIIYRDIKVLQCLALSTTTHCGLAPSSPNTVSPLASLPSPGAQLELLC
jgi:hypothetical protein